MAKKKPKTKRAGKAAKKKAGKARARKPAGKKRVSRAAPRRPTAARPRAVAKPTRARKLPATEDTNPPPAVMPTPSSSFIF